MNLNNYKKQLGKEELSIIQNSANNFVDNFSKVNMSEMVKGLINRSYNRINPVNDNDEMDSIVTSFSNDMVDDAVASRMLTFGAKIAPANYMESLSDLLYRYAKRESQERVDLIRMKIESGDVPTIGEDKKAFTSYVNKVFNTLSLSKRLDENFRADFSNISMEEEDILNTIKKEVIKEVEKTEDKQKLIHDIMEEVQDIKQEYADKLDNNDSDSDTKEELNGSESSKDDVDNSGSDSPDLQNSESLDMEGLFNKKKDNKNKKEEKVDAKKKKEIENKNKAEDKKAKEDAKNKKSKEDEDNIDDGEDKEGVGVTATYQNEDVFGGYSYHNMFESNNFESVGFPILTKELQSFEDAYYSILKNTISETFGSKEFLENAKTKMKMVISEENINKAIESLLSKEQSKFKGIADNIIKYKDSQLNQSLVKSNEDLKNESFEDKKFTINLANSNSVFNEILKTNDKFDKRYGDKFNMEGFDNKLKEKISNFFIKGIKNFSSNINKDNSIDIYQNWKLIERPFNINRSFEEFYNLCSYEDFTGTDAINEVQDMVPNNTIIDNKPIINDAMDDAKVVIKENNDNSEAETKTIDPQRGLEKNKENEMSDEALKIPLSSYDKVISKEVKKEAESVAKILPKLVEEAVLDVLVRQGEYNKWVDKMDQSYIRKAGLKLISPQELAKEYVKHCTFLSSSDINSAIDTSRSLLFAKKKIIPIAALPSPNYFRKYLATKFPKVPDSTLLKVGKFGLEWVVTNLVTNLVAAIPIYGASAVGAAVGGASSGSILGAQLGMGTAAIATSVVVQGLLTAGFIVHIIKGVKNSIAGYVNSKLKAMNLKYFKSNINLTGFLHSDKLLLQRFASMFGDKINVGLKIDFKLNSKEGFERIYGDDILIPNTIPNSLLKFETTPVFTAEHLSNIFMRKGSDKIMSLENKFNDAIGKLERMARRDNDNKAVEKLDIWKKNLRDARRIYNQKISAISSIGLSSEHIKDRFKYNPGTQAVVKNLLNRGYLNMEGLPLIGKLTDKKDYEHSIERLVDLTFDFHIRKNRWEKLYENASMAREDLEVREDNLEKALIEATPKDREFAEKLKSSLQFKDLDRFFTFDSIMMDFKTLFYKVNDTVDLKSLIDGDGLKTKVLQGLESKRGYIDDITKLYTDRYLAGSSIESIHPTRLEQFASKILRDTKASSTEEFNVLDDSVSENIRNKSILYLTMEVTRKALGCENARIKSETDQFLLS